ncbi:MAG: strawberry notch family protein [Anaerolineae bacterium]|nr:strawberry notch family protein [Anaerolineae bacterium]
MADDDMLNELRGLGQADPASRHSTESPVDRHREDPQPGGGDGSLPGISVTSNLSADAWGEPTPTADPKGLATPPPGRPGGDMPSVAPAEVRRSTPRSADPIPDRPEAVDPAVDAGLKAVSDMARRGREADEERARGVSIGESVGKWFESVWSGSGDSGQTQNLLDGAAGFAFNYLVRKQFESRGARSFGEGVSGMKEAMGTGVQTMAESAERRLGTGGLASKVASAAEDYARDAKLMTEASFLKPGGVTRLDEIRKEKWFNDVVDYAGYAFAKGAGTIVPLMLGGIATGGVGVIPMTFSMGLGEVRQSFDEEGVDPAKHETVLYAAGALHGTLEFIPGYKEIMGTIGVAVKKEVQKTLLRAVARGFVKGGVKEGLTEGTQTAIEIMAPIYAEMQSAGSAVGALWTDVMKGTSSKVIEAMVQGAIGGGPFEAVGAGSHKRHADIEAARKKAQDEASGKGGKGPDSATWLVDDEKTGDGVSKEQADQGRKEPAADGSKDAEAVKKKSDTKSAPEIPLVDEIDALIDEIPIVEEVEDVQPAADAPGVSAGEPDGATGPLQTSPEVKIESPIDATPQAQADGVVDTETSAPAEEPSTTEDVVVVEVQGGKQAEANEVKNESNTKNIESNDALTQDALGVVTDEMQPGRTVDLVGGEGNTSTNSNGVESNSSLNAEESTTTAGTAENTNQNQGIEGVTRGSEPSEPVTSTSGSETSKTESNNVDQPVSGWEHSSDSPKQGQVFVARETFSFKGGKGRPVTIKAGARLWSTSSQVANREQGVVTLAREGKGSIGQGWAFSREQLESYFTPEEDYVAPDDGTAIERSPDDIRDELRALISGTTPPKSWAQSLDISPTALEPYMDWAVEQGLLRKDKAGRWRRTAEGKAGPAEVRQPDPPETYTGEPLAPDEVGIIVDDWRWLRNFDARKKPQTMTQFVIAAGGINDAPDETGNKGGDIRHLIGRPKDRPGLINNQTGQTLDDAALNAWEAGFLPQFGERPSVSDFLDALQDDLHGGRVVRVDDMGYFDDLDAADEIARTLADYGITHSRFRKEADIWKYFGVEPATNDDATASGEVAGPEEGQAATGGREGPGGEVASQVDDLGDFPFDLPDVSGQDHPGGPVVATDATGQSSFVPPPTTGEQIAAASDRKNDRGEQTGDAGPLFNPDAGAQTDLMDLVRAPNDASGDVLAGYTLSQLREIQDRFSENYDRSLLPPGVAPMDLHNEIATRLFRGDEPSKNSQGVSRENFIAKLTSGTEDIGIESIASNGVTYRLDYKRDLDTYIVVVKDPRNDGIVVKKGPVGFSKWSLGEAADMAAAEAGYPVASADVSGGGFEAAPSASAGPEFPTSTEPPGDHVAVVGDDVRQNDRAGNRVDDVSVTTGEPIAENARDYARMLEEAALDRDAFRNVMEEIAADKSVTLPVLKGIASGYVGESVKARTRKQVIDRITDAFNSRIDALTSLEPETLENNEPVSGAMPDAPMGFDITPLVDRLLTAQPFKDIREARKFIASLGVDEESKKGQDEIIETAVVMAARRIVADGGKTPGQMFRELVDLYGRQPNLGSRDSTSIRNQAYSTPVPLAFVASQLAGVRGAESVYEPAAGNGALLIEANPDAVLANEIEPGRAQALREQGFQVTTVDGSQAPSVSNVQSVIMNPPFGAVYEGKRTRTFQVVGDWTTKAIDHAMSLNGLEAMADDGRAVLIIGGTMAVNHEERRKSYRGKSDFFYRLYNGYNVVDHFTMSGDLYKKQGAGFPVDVIVIEGRGKSARELPAKSPPPIITTWDDIGGKLGERYDNADTEPVKPASRIDRGRTGPTENNGGDRRPDEGRGSDAARTEPGREPEPVRGGSDRGQSDPVRPGGDGAESGRSDGGRDSSRARGNPPAQQLRPRIKRDRVEGEAQVPYSPGSMAAGLDTLIPTNMADAARNAIERTAASNGGSIDAFVADRLGYNVSELPDAFSAEQVDALALAIENVEKGAAFIIGDQTGIGKGRVVAGMLRYAMRHNFIPVFVTEKPNLYGDIYRDLTDIGVPTMLGRDMNLFMTNANESVALDEEAVQWKAEDMDAKAEGTTSPPKTGKFLDKIGPKRTQDRMNEIRDADTHDIYDVVFTTYDQLNTRGKMPNPRRPFIQAIAPRSLMVFDESHNAGGVEKTGWESSNGPMTRADFVRELAKTAKGVMFSSATYAKRPGVMDLYARTDMGKAVSDPRKLPELIKKGGVPMQQIVAGMLSDSGQYLRRERSFDGITYNLTEVDVDRVVYGNFSKAMQAIYRFDRAIAKEKKEIIKDWLDENGMKITKDDGVGESSASSISFGSLMHNIVSQMLLSISADAAADRAIEAHKRGEKPVITLANTNESFITDLAEQMGVSFGQALNVDFSSVLAKYLERTLRVTIKHPNDTIEHLQIPITKFNSRNQRLHSDANNIITGSDFGNLAISPIDRIRGRLEDEGISVKEITGRKTSIDYKGEVPIYAKRNKKEIGAIGKQVTIREFNSGKLDCIILNRSGSTGLSIHSYYKFRDQRPRTMVLAQIESNIDVHMQTLGRVNRSGQTTLPRYEHISPDIPAAARPTAVAMKKMASLNANTTGARSSSFTVSDADFMNEVGDKVVSEILMDDYELNDLLGDPLGKTEEKDYEDIAKVASGNLTILDVEQQEAFFETVQARYRSEIEQLDASGANPLEAKTVDLQARTLETVEVKPSSGDSPFLSAVKVEKVSVKSQGKAHAPETVANRIVEGIKGKMPSGEIGQIFSSLYSAGTSWMIKEIGRLTPGIRKQIQDEVGSVKPDSAASTRKRLEDQFNRWKLTMGFMHPGAAISLAMPDETIDGVVLSIERTGKAKAMMALGSWEARIAVPSSAIEYRIPLSRVFVPGVEMAEKDTGISVSVASVPIGDLPKLFIDSRKEGRETRHMFTGNLLSAYESSRGVGRIMNYTTEDGRLVPGILMPKYFNTKDFMANRTVRLVSGAAVIEYLNRFGEDYIVEGNQAGIAVTRLRNGFMIEVASPRSVGGMFYTNSDVIEVIAPRVFERHGSIMTVEGLDAQKAAETIDVLASLGVGFEVHKEQDAAQEINNQVAPLKAYAFRSTPKPRIPGRDAMRGRVSDAAAQRMPQIGAVLERSLRRMLPSDVAIRIVDRITHVEGDIAGYYDHGAKLLAISMAYDEKNAIQTAWHEVVHALRKAGAFSQAEWQTLLDMGKRTGVDRRIYAPDPITGEVVANGIEGYRKLYTQDFRRDGYSEQQIPGMVAEMLDQERVATMVEAWSSGSRLGEVVDALLARVVNVVRAIKEALRSIGMTRTADLVETAEVAGIRGRMREGMMAAELERRTSERERQRDAADVTRRSPAGIAALRQHGVEVLPGQPPQPRQDAYGRLDAIRSDEATPQRETQRFDLLGFRGEIDITTGEDGYETRTYRVLGDRGPSVVVTQRPDGAFEMTSLYIPSNMAGSRIGEGFYDAIEAHLGSTIAATGILSPTAVDYWRSKNPDLVSGHVDGGGLFDGMWVNPASVDLMGAVIEAERKAATTRDQLGRARMRQEMLAEVRGRLPTEAIESDRARVLFAESDRLELPSGPDPDMLLVAQDLLANGVDRLEVVGRTGWAQNSSGQWVYVGETVQAPNGAAYAFWPRSESRSAQVRSIMEIIGDIKTALQMPSSQGLNRMSVTYTVEDENGDQRSRIRRVRPTRWLRGQYDRLVASHRYRIATDIEEVATSGAFHLEHVFGAPLTRLIEDHEAELDSLVPPGSPVINAFAIWFKDYVLYPDNAMAIAPTFYAAFEDFLDANGPDVLQGIERLHVAQASADWQQYLKASDLERASADLKRDAPSGLWERSKKVVDALGQGKTYTGIYHIVYQAIADQGHTINRVVRSFLDIADRNRVTDAQGRAMSLAVHENPYKLIRSVGDAFKTGLRWMQDGMPEYRNANGPRSASLTDALELACGSEMNDGKFQSFGVYLESRRAVAEWETWNDKVQRLADMAAQMQSLANARTRLQPLARNLQDRLARRQRRLAQQEALENDRDSVVTSINAEIRRVQQRMQDLRDEIASLRGDKSKTVEEREDIRKRRRASLRNAEARNEELQKRLAAAEQDAGVRNVGNIMLGDEIKQISDQLAMVQDRLNTAEAMSNQIRSDRRELQKSGMQRPPHRISKDVHERRIEKLEEENPTFEQAAVMVYEFQWAQVMHDHAAGRLSDAQIEYRRTRAHYYVPFSRDISDVDLGLKGAGAGVKRFAKDARFLGSDRNVIHPIQTIISKTFHQAAATHFNEVMLAMKGLAESVGPGGADIAEVVPQEEMVETTEAELERLTAHIESLGHSREDAENIVQSIETDLADPQLLLRWDPVSYGATRPLLVPFWEGGQRKFIRFNDAEFAQGVHATLSGIGREMSTVLIDILSTPATILRSTVTMHPAFIGHNMIRDSMTATTILGGITNPRAWPVILQAQGLYHELFQTDTARRYQEVAGIMGGQNVASLSKVRDKLDHKAMMEKGLQFRPLPMFLATLGASAIGGLVAGPGGAMMASFGGIAMHRIMRPDTWVSMLAHMADMSETATRLGAFALSETAARQYNPDLTDYQAAQEAAYVARDLIDFGRRGSRMLVAAKLVPFLNANIQGLDKAQRTLLAESDRGKEVSPAKMSGVVAAGVGIGGVLGGPTGAVAGGVLAPTVAMQLAARSENVRRVLEPFGRRMAGLPMSLDSQRAVATSAKAWAAVLLYTGVAMTLKSLYMGDPEYQRFDPDITNRQLPVKIYGQWIGIPKHFELALPSSIAEAVIDQQFGGHTDMWKRIRHAAQESLAPPMEAQAFRLFADIRANYDSFRKKQIVNDYIQKDLPPAERLNGYSSQLAITLASWANKPGNKGVVEAVGNTVFGNDFEMTPMLIDYVLTTGFGYVGKDIAKLSNVQSGIGPRSGSIIEYPIIGTMVQRFHMDPERMNAAHRIFYKMVGRSGDSYTRAATNYAGLLAVDLKTQNGTTKSDLFLSGMENDEQRAYALLENQKAQYQKNFHPLNRARDTLRVIRSIQNDILLERLVDSSSRSDPRPIKLSPAKAASLRDVLNTLASIEAENAMIVLKEQQWRHRPMRDPKPAIDAMRAISTEVADQYDVLMSRASKGRGIFSRTRPTEWADIQAEWGGIRDRLLQDWNEAKAASEPVPGARRARVR